MRTIVHVSHEAVHKIGGIGSVLEGLITSHNYAQSAQRTILLGPLFSREGNAETRLGVGGEVLYSPIDGVHDHPLADALRAIEYEHSVAIVYGKRRMVAFDTGIESMPEVLLIDVANANTAALAHLKFRMFEAFGIASDRHDGVWDFEQYMRLALPGLAAVRALGACGPTRECIVVAHEYMGMPTALAARLDPSLNCRTLFHAHEVATVRHIVETHPAYETMFYNVMRQAVAAGQSLDDVFGSQDHYFKHPLVRAAKHCHGVMAVGDEVARELRFLDSAFDDSIVRVAYNGIPAYRTEPSDRIDSRRLLKTYTRTLLGFTPDHIFTHVTRLVPSKGLWRDLDVLAHMDEAFAKDGRTAVLFVLSTEIGGPRRHEDIVRMEREYGWPVAHREHLPDLTEGEARFYTHVQRFNARARHCKVVFVNQFGFDRECCGTNMPAAMSFWDIRRGSDVEFGQSIYEPFGIAQVEALSFGSICVISSVCGCAGFVRHVSRGTPAPNAIEADFTRLDQPIKDIDLLRQLTHDDHRRIELRAAKETATELLRHLPPTDEGRDTIMHRGRELATGMSWDVVARDYFNPAVETALKLPV